MIEQAATPYFDDTLAQRLSEAKDEATEAVAVGWQELTAPELEQLDDINAHVLRIIEPYREQLAELGKRLTRQLKPIKERLERVSRAVHEKSALLDAYLIDRPTPQIMLPDETGWLFDSARSYLEQLEVYKKRQGKDNPVLDEALVLARKTRKRATND